MQHNYENIYQRNKNTNKENDTLFAIFISLWKINEITEITPNW